MVEKRLNIQVTEIDGPASTAISSCPASVLLLLSQNQTPVNGWAHLPRCRLEYNPHLLKYSCQIQCRVRPVSPAKVWRTSILDRCDTEGKSDRLVNGIKGKTRRDISMGVMLSKPILALEFNCLKMVIEPPLIVTEGSHNTAEL